MTNQTYIRLVLISIIILISITKSAAQGCVAIRQFSCTNGTNLESNLLKKGDFQIGMNYRYFKSFRHFRGTEEEADRVSNNTEVINHSHSWDFQINYGVNDRLFSTLTIPQVINTRSSLYEHGREERYTTFSRGLGDIRLGLGYWLLDPNEHPTGNLSLGTGIKLPTGNYNASDIFYNVGPEGSSQVRPVDQSIQPGDGGIGFTINLQFYQKISNRFIGYGGGFYLFNPKEVNGIRTFRETLSPILENEAIMSVPDQFAIRAGLGYNINDVIFSSLGARYEGVPVKDVFGGSNGFRRPGNVLSVEPGLDYMKNQFTISLNVPIAVRRERPQSITDLQTQRITGEFRQGDAAFADYAINFGIAYRFSIKKIEKFSSDSPIHLDKS